MLLLKRKIYSHSEGAKWIIVFHLHNYGCLSFTWWGRQPPERHMSIWVYQILFLIWLLKKGVLSLPALSTVLLKLLSPRRLAKTSQLLARRLSRHSFFFSIFRLKVMIALYIMHKAMVFCYALKSFKLPIISMKKAIFFTYRHGHATLFKQKVPNADCWRKYLCSIILTFYTWNFLNVFKWWRLIYTSNPVNCN